MYLIHLGYYHERGYSGELKGYKSKFKNYTRTKSYPGKSYPCSWGTISEILGHDFQVWIRSGNPFLTWIWKSYPPRKSYPDFTGYDFRNSLESEIKNT